MNLAIIIVSWNTRDLLRACLRSLLVDAGIDAHIIVVDSASSDGSPEMVRTEFPIVELIACQDNIGYVKGNNLAMRRLSGSATMDDRRWTTDQAIVHRPSSIVHPRYLWLLNPDTLVQPGAIKALLDFMETHPKCGLCGPQLRNPDGSLQHGAFALPGLLQLWIDVVPRLQARFRNTKWDGRYATEQYASGQPFQIGAPLGAAMLARTSAVQDIGLLDDGFEMYSEELDWAARMHEADWEVWCVPSAIVTHYGGASSSQASTRAERLKWQSRQRYYRKHYSPIKRWLALQSVPSQFRSSSS